MLAKIGFLFLISFMVKGQEAPDFSSGDGNAKVERIDANEKRLIYLQKELKKMRIKQESLAKKITQLEQSLKKVKNRK